MQLILDEREAALLDRVLTNYLPELHDEIYKTENYDWRQDLKRDEETLRNLVERLKAAKIEETA